MTAALSTTEISVTDEGSTVVVRSWRLRVVQTAERLLRVLSVIPGPFRIVYTVSRLAFQGFAIGLLRPADMDQFVTDGYRRSTDAYDPRRYELPHDEHMLPTLKQVASGRQLLDAFCGQGREAELLVDAGFEVTGVDRLASMISGARQYAAENSFDATFVCADFCELDESTTYDVVYTSCWMYSTFQGTAARLAFLNKCRRLCRPEGIIVVSFDHRVASKPVSRTRHVIAGITGFLSGGNRNSEIGDHIASSGLFWRCHTQESVKREVNDADLHVVACLEGIDDVPTFFFLTPNAPTNRQLERSAR